MIRQFYNILFTFLILATGVACGGPSTPTSPPKSINVINEPSKDPYINVEVKDVKILGSVGDPLGAGELRLFVVVTDGRGQNNGLACPYDKTISIKKGQTFQPCFTGISVNENTLQDEFYVMIVAIDEDSSHPFVDLGYEGAMATLGNTLNSMVKGPALKAAAAAVGVGTVPETAIVIGASTLISYAGGELKDWLEKQDIISVQVLKLERAKDWNSGDKIHLITQDNQLDIEIWINRTKTPEEPVVLVVTQEPIIVIVTQEPDPSSTEAQLPNPNTANISNKDNMPMIQIPAGSFNMGSNDSDSWARNDEKPVHEIYLNSYWIDRHEVTVRMYRSCVDAGVCRQAFSSPDGGPDYPVTGVSWEDAKTYCEWVGRRLPTEAEWEKAARGTDGRTYPWGNTFDGNNLNFCDVNCDAPFANVNYNDGYKSMAPVESFPDGISFYGLFDMAGNVLEWVMDWYDPSFYGYSQSQNPTGPKTGDRRVVRGGAYDSEIILTMTTYREAIKPTQRRGDVGFRCALSE